MLNMWPDRFKNLEKAAIEKRGKQYQSCDREVIGCPFVIAERTFKNVWSLTPVLWYCPDVIIKVGKTARSKEADYVLEHIHNLAQVIPEIWVGGTESGDQRISRPGSEMDAILSPTTVGA